MNVLALIPAYNPGEPLLRLVESLVQLGFGNIIIVNDGSRPECSYIFEKLTKMKGCHVLHHAFNLGKGRALKTGFNYAYLNFPGLSGIVTADADGQHLPEDILKVTETFLKNPSNLVLGSRRFGEGTPMRSLIGNTLTRYVFHILVGRKISDTQSGLRCIPMSMLPYLMGLEGERYEYEMNMLISTKTVHTDILEEEITTVYLDNNRSSHFNPLIDSMKIYFLLLRFSFSSIFASTIDFLVFTSTYMFNKNILMGMVLARTVSGGLNFYMNKSLVFHSQQGTARPLVKYFMLFIVLAVLSYASIRTMSGFGINVILAKVLSETVLFLASFTIQRDFIFNTSNKK